MAENVEITLKVTGARELEQALKRLGRRSHTLARRAVNRTIGVARQRVIKSVSRATGIPRRVLGGTTRRKSRATGQVQKGRGYIKHVKASRRRSAGALVGLVEGVRFSALKRQRLGGARRKPGGQGQAFRQRMPSGKSTLFERRAVLTRTSRADSPGTRRANLPIREVVIPIQPHAERAIRVHMRRTARSVYPQKLWEEIQRFIQRRERSATRS